jgi:hypothetical protein
LKGLFHFLAYFVIKACIQFVVDLRMTNFHKVSGSFEVISMKFFDSFEVMLINTKISMEVIARKFCRLS